MLNRSNKTHPAFDSCSQMQRSLYSVFEQTTLKTATPKPRSGDSSQPSA